MLTVLPWGMQESGAGGLRVDARAGRSNERKAPTATADKAGTQGRHGARQGQGENMEARGNLRGQKPREWGETIGAARPPEWRKTPGGAATEWAGGSSRLRTT